MKLTKDQARRHKQACELLKKEVLTYEDKIFVLENWHEGAEHMNGTAGAFFTPSGLARDFQLAVNRYGRVIDLCAGIGSLSFHLMQQANFSSVKVDLVCLELNRNYIEVGKKIVPEATWIEGSVFDFDLIMSLGKFDQAISNPPFGNIKTGSSDEKKYLKYTGSDFDLKVIEVASIISDFGAFILPQMSTPFRYSGCNTMSEERTDKVKKFEEQTKLEYEMNCGIDTSIYKDEWNGVCVICEVAIFDFTSKVNQDSYAKQQVLF